MKILIAPDKFKGSLTAKEVCEGIRSALRSWDSTLEIVSLPQADGGEGTLEVLSETIKSHTRKIIARDPLFRIIESAYGISDDGTTAFIELAQASGLQRLKEHERNPMIATTIGTGELIRDALDKGAQRIILGIGGSATNDAGMGIAEALGVKFFDADERRLEPIGKNLVNVAFMDTAELHPRVKEVSFTILCDVENPLHGPNGAAFVFSPQKGATPAMVAALDDGLRAYEKILTTTFSRQVNFPGAGAAGGVASTLAALADIQIRPGMEFLAELTQLKKQIENADVIITGEGKMDRQTLSGKVIKGIASLAAPFNKPVFALVGKNELSTRQWREMGVHRVIPLQDGSLSDQEAIKNAFSLLQERVREEIIPLLLSRRGD